MPKQRDDSLRCSFCGKSQREVEKIIAGPNVFICNECVDICVEILRVDDDDQSPAYETTQEKPPMTTKYESADLILKLYELRREPKMREARDWFARFDPQSAQDVMNAVMGEHSAHFRMVATYWDMAASLVNQGAIDFDMFTEANMEHVFVYSKIEPFVTELRQMFGSPHAWKNLEQVVMQLPDAKERMEAIRERSKRMAQMRAEAEARATHTEAANA